LSAQHSPFASVFDGQAIRLPEQVQSAIAQGVTTTRASFDKAAEYAKENMKAAEKIVRAAQTGSQEIGEKVLHNAEANAKAAFEAAATLATAKTLPELARLQTNFIQQQLSAMHQQNQELFQLSAQLAQQTFATFNSAFAKSVEQFRKNG
jgi:hypothetical protein